MRTCLFCVALLVAAAGCGGASPETGIGANLRLTNAQFVPGPIVVDPNATGPTAFVNFGVPRLTPGIQNVALSGDVQAGTSVLLGLDDDGGHWIVPAPTRNILEEDSFQFSTRMSLSPETPAGAHLLIVRGIDAAGNIGPSKQYSFIVTPPVPTGALVFRLTWDTQADLDLHVLVPNPAPDPVTGGPGAPIEIWSRNQIGLPPTSVPRTPEETKAALAAAGRLDFDSNSSCLIDGRRQEDVIFTEGPPDGEYIARVDTASLCGQASAQWQLTVSNPDGYVVNPATWESTDPDTRGPHGPGAGLLAVQFTLPF